MSITVRLWTKDQMAKFADGKDLKELTAFINKSTFNEDELRAYYDIPVTLNHTYVTTIDDELIEFKAANDDMAKWFISQEYIVDMADIKIFEKTIQYREIK